MSSLNLFARVFVTFRTTVQCRRFCPLLDVDALRLEVEAGPVDKDGRECGGMAMEVGKDGGGGG